MSKLIFTASPEASDAALAELRAAAPDSKPIKWPEPGVCMAECGQSFGAISAALTSLCPVFMRHIAPADNEADTPEQIGEWALPLLKQGERFSVQVRAAGGNAALRADTTEKIGSILEAAGFSSSREQPDAIVSVYYDGRFHWGVSPSAQNLSSWPGGMIRFARTEATASRAEFKLLEVFATCPVALPQGGAAIDLGAAPGGWTRILAQKGFRVDAIDPAELDPAVKALPGVTHYRCTSQEYVKQPHQKADLIVNDMKMDVGESAAILCECAQLLASGGMAVMTFKLPADKWGRRIKYGTELLEREFDVLWKKQLFHNRSEITVVAAKKNS